MSIALPTLIEKDIRQGKARYQTFQTGIGGQSVLKVPDNMYIVIFGYDYSPAGGGIRVYTTSENVAVGAPDSIKPFETQQISFYTGQAFHPFIHHVDMHISNVINEGAKLYYNNFSIDNTPLNRSTYIISNRSVSIAVGLMQGLDPEAPGVRFGPIAATQNTPGGLSYGGDGNVHAVQTFLSSATGSIFTQPSIEKVDFYETGFAPQPNADGQVYLKPEVNSTTTGIGLIDPSDYIEQIFGTDFSLSYATHYFLNVHYALYTNQTPEQLG